MKRADGSYIRFDENAAVILNAKMGPNATRILGPIPRELKEKGFEKSMANATIGEYVAPEPKQAMTEEKAIEFLKGLGMTEEQILAKLTK